jgi:hypothetical protein
MSVIEEVLKHSKKHAQVIILILLGVIAAGSIAGGLYIQNLNSMLAEKDKLHAQEIKMLEYRYSNSLATVKLINQNIELMINKSELSIQASTSKIDQMTKELDSFANTQTLDSQTKDQLLGFSKVLINHASQLSGQLEFLKITIRTEIDEFTSKRLYSPPYYGRPSLIGPFFWLSFSFLLLLTLSHVLWMKYLSRTRKILLTRIHLEKAKGLLQSRTDSQFEASDKESFDALDATFDELELVAESTTCSLEFWMEMIINLLRNKDWQGKV